jgi:hypothetical protein
MDGHDTAGFNPRFWIALFVGLEFLSPGLLFLPGTQAIRPLIRAIPYVSSLGMLSICARLPAPSHPLPGRTPLLFALLVLFLGLIHPATHVVTGLAQCTLQLCIAAPAFWADRLLTTAKNFRFLIWSMFLANGASAALGVLQVYYPQAFMPPEFSAAGLALHPQLLEDLSYRGAHGERIIRPPGLSDLPGGAATTGTVAGFLGIALAVQAHQPVKRRVLCIVLAGMGVLAVYLTQVRSLMVMMIVALVILCGLSAWRGRVAQAGRVAGLAGALVVGAFLWAVTIGGEAIAGRFLGIVEEGPLESFRRNRGQFVEYTFRQELGQYPLGAGVGRWGMMSIYFRKYDSIDYQSLYAEIQATGWLFDGGVPMLLCYGTAIGLALLNCYRFTVRTKAEEQGDEAAIAFALGLLIVGQSFAGPTFNTTMGIQFWILMAGLHGAALTRAYPKPQPRRVTAVLAQLGASQR